MRDVFSVQSTQWFIHTFMLLGIKMKLWMFDHSGPYSSGPFNIYNQSEKFIRALMDYTLMNNDELDLNNFIQHNSQDNLITIQKDTTRKNIKIQLKPQLMIIQ